MNELLHVLGNSGFSPAAVLMSALNFSVIVWWIRGMAERRRAETEQKNADAKITGDQYDRLVSEVARLDARVVTLEKTVAVKDGTIAELIALKLQTLAEHAAERVLSAARDAENKTIIAALKARLAESQPLVAATEHAAEAMSRVADAAEFAVKGSG